MSLRALRLHRLARTSRRWCAARDRREAYWGLGVAAWAGYDAWISSNWSLAGYLRVMAARTTRQVDYSGSPLVDEQANGSSLAVLFTALYH